MPKLNGFEVLAWLQTRPEFGSIPVVVLTGCDLGADRVQAQKLGAAGYEVKPLAFKSLVTTIKSIGTRWLNPPA